MFRLDCDTVVSVCGLCDFGWFLFLVCLLVVNSDFSGLVCVRWWLVHARVSVLGYIWFVICL